MLAPTIPAPQIPLLFNRTSAAKQAKAHRHVPSIYNQDGTLRLTMVDILRLFADRPEVQHFDTLRALDLIPELEKRITAYVHAGGSITFSSANSANLMTPDAFAHVPGARYLTLADCLKRDHDQ